MMLKIRTKPPTHAPFTLNVSADRSALLVQHWRGVGTRVPPGHPLRDVQFVLPMEDLRGVRVEEVEGRVSYLIGHLDYSDPIDASLDRAATLEFWLDGSERSGRASDYRDRSVYFKVLTFLEQERPELFPA